jgi:hypothetical protein
MHTEIYRVHSNGSKFFCKLICYCLILKILNEDFNGFLWIVALCSVTGGYLSFVGNHLQDYMALQPRRPQLT